MSTYNFLGLVNDVNRRLNEVELTSANFSAAIGFYSSVKDGVNSSIREVNHQVFEWPFNHVTQEESLNVGEVRYFLPLDVKTLDLHSFRIKEDAALGNPTVKLKIIAYEEYLDKHLKAEYSLDSSFRGIPQYVFRSPSLEYGVIPSPDKEYSIVYEYYRNPLDLVLYSDTPSIPEEFRYVILDGAMVHAHTFRGDNESAELARVRYEKGLDHMRAIYVNRYDYVRSTMIDRCNGN